MDIADAKGKEQAASTDRVIRRPGDVPNDGWLDLSWETDKVSRFLRSMDYGALMVMGRAKVMLDGEIYTVEGYKMPEISLNGKAGGKGRYLLKLKGSDRRHYTADIADGRVERLRKFDILETSLV